MNLIGVQSLEHATRKIKPSKQFAVVFNSFIEWLSKALEGSDDAVNLCDHNDTLAKFNMFLNQIRIISCPDKRFGFDPILSISRAVSRLDGSMKILLDHLMRRAFWARPAQTRLYTTNRTPIAQYAQRPSFNRPHYFYYCCPQNSSIFDVAHSDVQEIILPMIYISETPQIRIYDDRCLFFTQDGALIDFGKGNRSFGKNPHYFEEVRKARSFSETDLSITNHGSNYFVLENGKIFDYVAHQDVDIYLNNTIANDLSIKKIAFSTEINNEVEVLVLFDRLFMAQGTLRVKPLLKCEPDEYPFFCDLAELPGSYGTTDFLCSPNFKSFVRISHLTPTTPKKTRNLRNEMIQLRKMIRATLNLVLRCVSDRYLHRPGHTGFSDILCQLLNISVTVYNEYEQNKHRRIPFFSARENLHFIYHNVSTAKPITKKHKCSVLQCPNMRRFLDICKLYACNVYNVMMDAETRVEYGYQLLSILEVLRTSFPLTIEPSRSELRRLMSRLMFSYMYSLEATQLFFIFHEVPPMVKPLVLDIMLRNIKQSDVNIAASLYDDSSAPEAFTKRLHGKIVVEAMRKHPHAVLFGRYPANLKSGLIRSLGQFLDYSIIWSGNYVEVERDIKIEV